MLYHALRADRIAPDLAGELDRARRIAVSLVNPHDLNIVHRYIAELEARLARSAEDSSSAR